jgi:hypothetical protein
LAILDWARKAVEQTAGSNAGRNLFLFLLRGITGLDFDQIGTVRELEVDLRKGFLKAILDLKGDPTPLVIEELLFRTKQNEKSMIEILSIKTDREWMNTIASLAVPHSVKLDPKLVSLLDFLR